MRLTRNFLLKKERESNGISLKDAKIRIELLYELDVTHSHLTSININTFVGLDLLRELNLEGNYFRSFPVSVFRDLARLERLYLNINEFTRFKAGMFHGLLNLKYLNLAYNRINSIDSEAFSDLINLKELNLSHNTFTQLNGSMFASLTKLEILNMSNNQINWIQPNTFAHLTKLRVLNLSSNLLTNFNANLLTWSTNLDHVYLNQNQLKIIDFEDFAKFKNIQVIALNGNCGEFKSFLRNSFDKPKRRKIEVSIYFVKYCMSTTVGLGSGESPMILTDLNEFLKKMQTYNIKCPECEQKVKNTEWDGHSEKCRELSNMALSCPICLGLVKKNARALGCGHCMCSGCFQTWFKVPEATSMSADDNDLLIKCPTCRQQISKEKSIILY